MTPQHPQCGHPTLPNSPEIPSIAEEEKLSIMSCNQNFHHVMQPKNYPKHDYTKVGAQFAGMGRDHCCHCTLHTHNMCHTPLPSPPQANTRTHRPHGSMMRGFEQSAQPQAPASTVAQHAHASLTCTHKTRVPGSLPGGPGLAKALAASLLPTTLATACTTEATLTPMLLASCFARCCETSSQLQYDALCSALCAAVCSGCCY